MSQQLIPGQPIVLTQGQSSMPSATDDMFVSNDDAFPQDSAQNQPIQSTQPQDDTQYIADDSDDNNTQVAQSVIRTTPPAKQVPVVELPQKTVDSDDFFDEDDEDIDFPQINASPSAATQIPQMQKVQPPSTGMFSKPAAPGAISLSKMPEDQRREVISRIFKLVLGREPVEKDYNYYRFSALTEDGLIRNLLNLQEHKTFLDQAKQFGNVKKSQSDMEMKVKYLEMHLQSIQDEMSTLQELLAEKNRYIQNLRQTLQTVSGSQHPLPIQEVAPQPVQQQPTVQRTQPQIQQAQPQRQQAPQFVEPQGVQYYQPKQEEVSQPTPAPVISAPEEIPVEQQFEQSAPATTASTLPSPVDELRNMVAKFIRGK